MKQRDLAQIFHLHGPIQGRLKLANTPSVVDSEVIDRTEKSVSSTQQGFVWSIADEVHNLAQLRCRPLVLIGCVT